MVPNEAALALVTDDHGQVTFGCPGAYRMLPPIPVRGWLLGSEFWGHGKRQSAPKPTDDQKLIDLPGENGDCP